MVVVCFLCVMLVFFPISGAFGGWFIRVYLGLEGFRCFSVSCF